MELVNQRKKQLVKRAKKIIIWGKRYDKLSSYPIPLRHFKDIKSTRKIWDSIYPTQPTKPSYPENWSIGI